MAYFSFNNIKITGLAGAVPKNIVKTTSFYDVFGKSEVDKFIEQTGIKESRRTVEHQTASDLAFTAANALLNKKNINRNEIGALVFVSVSPDYRRPATAFILQKRLGISKEAAVFDVNLGCTSLVYGFQVVASIMNNSDINKALLIMGDTAHKSVNPKDRSSLMIFGDAGSVVMLEKNDDTKPIKALLRSDGDGYRYMIVPGGGYRDLNPSDEVTMCLDGNPRSLYNSFIQGTSVYTFTIFDVPKLVKDFWAKTETTVEDYEVFAFHQANGLILKQIAKKLKIPVDKMPLSLDKYGNTSGGSPIITLIDSFAHTEPRKINTLFCGFGIGLSWGVFSAEINTEDIIPIIEDDEIFEEGIIKNPNDLYSGLQKK